MPLQSLSLLNSEFTLQRARDLVLRLDRECKASKKARIQWAFLLVCSREPDVAECLASEEFLLRQQLLHAAHGDSDQRAWQDFAQSLFTLNDCLYLR
jgi:hypothetical protein